MLKKLSAMCIQVLQANYTIHLTTPNFIIAKIPGLHFQDSLFYIINPLKPFIITLLALLKIKK